MTIQPKSVRDRRGAVIVLSALLMVVLLGITAFAVDVGYMMLLKTQLQLAADAGAMAAGNSMHLSPTEVSAKASEYVAHQFAGGRNVQESEATVETGIWDMGANSFTPTSGMGNAVRVTAYREHEPLFFGRVLGNTEFRVEATAIAMANPRDIAFVVDLSGSMNDDTEPAWATQSIADKFSGSGYGSVGNDLMQDVFADLGFGAFPGTLEYVGAPLGVASDSYAYATLTSDVGPLSGGAIPGHYRIKSGDSETGRKAKAYRYILEQQIARVMPNVRPAATMDNYAYWEKYLDYIIEPVYIAPPSPPPPPDDDDGGGGVDDDDTPPPPPPPPPPPTPPIGYHLPKVAPELWMLAMHPRLSTFTIMQLAMQPGTPPDYRGWIPASQDGDRIDRFNNPNKATFPSASSSLPRGYRNQIGYLTYVQFLMDHGRDLHPDGTNLVPLSLDSGECWLHTESTPGGNFAFPPRTQPMHACRRALIAAIATIEDRNEMIPNMAYRDHVSVVSFDTLDNGELPELVQSLTGDYPTAMLGCTRLQAVGDKGMTTATEAGLDAAAHHLKPVSQGGQGREQTAKVVVLLTDGVPNAYQSSDTTIDTYLVDNPSGDFYGGGYYWLDAALMQAAKMKTGKTELYPVGIGLGTDYGFMDRMARMGDTAGVSGTSPRGSGNPAEYEAVLTDIFERIITSPTARLVE